MEFLHFFQMLTDELVSLGFKDKFLKLTIRYHLPHTPVKYNG